MVAAELHSGVNLTSLSFGVGRNELLNLKCLENQSFSLVLLSESAVTSLTYFVVTTGRWAVSHSQDVPASSELHDINYYLSPNVSLCQKSGSILNRIC